MKISFSFILALVCLVGITSCNKNKEPKPDDSGRFVKFFGTAGMSQAYCIAETSDGYVLAGYSIQDRRTDKDIYVIKTDRNGNKLWERRIETNKNEIARHLRIESSGDIVLVGTQVQANNDAQAVMFTLNSNGEVIGQRLFGKPTSHEDAYHISRLEGGDFLIAGIDSTAGDKNTYITRIAPDTVVWEFDLGPNARYDALSRIVELGDGNLLWCGTAARAGGNNIRTVLSSPQGEIVWSYEFDLNTAHEYGRDIVPTSDGGFIIIGSRGEENTDSEQLLLMKIDQYGNKVWESLPVSETSGGYSVQPISSGGYIVSGYKKLDTGNTDMLLMKIDEDGSTTWVKNFGGKRKDQGRMAIETENGYFTMVGYVDLFGDVNNVFGLIRTDADGNINEPKK